MRRNEPEMSFVNICGALFYAMNAPPLLNKYNELYNNLIITVY